jgi:hypothetical protein
LFPELAPYYNADGLTTAFVTMDVDWAPDPVLKYCLDWFMANDMKITAFITHDSAVAKAFARDPRIEWGLHPNFSRSYVPNERVRALKEIYPEAIGSRGHRNVCGRDVTDALLQCGLQYDVSKLLWNHPYAQVTPMYNGLVEAPYVWEDGVHLEMRLPLEPQEIPVSGPGLKILNIHPVTFFLNNVEDSERKAVVSKYPDDLTKAPLAAFEKGRRKGLGIGEFARSGFLKLKKAGVRFHLLSEIMKPAYAAWNRRR